MKFDQEKQTNNFFVGTNWFCNMKFDQENKLVEV
jgi:hypothetical protein